MAFLETRGVIVPGIDSDEIEICRIGMSGTLAYELRGPAEFGPEVYDAVAAELERPTRMIVSLVWNLEDVVDVYRSQISTMVLIRNHQICATIAKYPYSRLVENKDYNLSTVPAGYE